MNKKLKLKMPSTYTVIYIIIILVAILSWIVPGGSYEYDEGDEGNPRPIPGTFEAAESNPQGVGDIIMASVTGFMDSVDIILYTLVIGGFLGVVMRTGAINAGISYTMKKLHGREQLLIPALMTLFFIAGAAFGIEEETLPFFLVLIPVLLVAGYDTLTGISVIKLGAGLGVLATVASPFSVAIASRFAGISIGDGIVIRLILLAVYLPSGLYFVMRYAAKVKKDPSTSLVYNQKEENEKHFLKEIDTQQTQEFTRTRKLVLLIFAGAFVVMMWGVLPWDDLGLGFIPTMNWWFGELTAIFLVASVVIMFVARIKEEEFIDTFIKGSQDLLGVAIIIGIARGVAVVMSDARITDTVLHAGETLLSHTPTFVFPLASYIVFFVLSFFIPSSSGLATLSMEIIAPMADFAGVGREIVVIAYQTGNAMISMISPTVAILMGVLVMTRTSYLTWIKFVWKFMLYIIIVTIVILIVATYIIS